VKIDRSLIITGNRTLGVKIDRSLIIAGNRTLGVKIDRSLIIMEKADIMREYKQVTYNNRKADTRRQD
jgi:hypothetical protein